MTYGGKFEFKFENHKKLRNVALVFFGWGVICLSKNEIEKTLLTFVNSISSTCFTLEILLSSP